MKIKITENQFKRILREIKEEKVLNIPSFSAFNNDWKTLQKFLTLKGNPKWSMKGDLNLYHAQIESLGDLTSVGGDLDLFGTPIKSLGNLTSVGGLLDLRGTSIKSLENLTSVGGDLLLYNSQIKSLENLTSVGGGLYLRGTPISKKYSEDEIREQVDVGGEIYY